MENKENNTVFETLNSINVNQWVEKKNTGKTTLSYLSWSNAWAETKKRYPDANYEIVKFENGLPYAYDKATGYMVYTKVTIENVTHEMFLPVLDSHNDAMLAEPYEVKTRSGSYTVPRCTMFDVNKAIMRCLTKNLAMFGLGLYIYSGEDLPADSPEVQNLVLKLEEWLSTGVLQGDFERKAQYYIKQRDVEGMKKTIDWCEANSKSA
ncbi:MAG: DUF1071 domain-containing protein [Methanobrevibacter sp.]|nr:DUF1071 domain-containing protein [Methanobrevibacter sp.]